MNLPEYAFVHLSSPTKTGGIGANVSRSLKLSENESLRLQIQGCEDLIQFDAEIPGLKSICVFAVISSNESQKVVSDILIVFSKSSLNI